MTSMTDDDWWLEYGLPLHEAIDATMDGSPSASKEARLAILVEKCPWLLTELPGATPATPADDGPEWVPFTSSSTIDAIRTEPKHIGVSDLAKLFVRFKSGATYVYEDVPGATVADLCMADSPGAFFAAHIKGKFLTTKVADAEQAA